AKQILRINSTEPRFLDYAEDNLDFYQNNMYRSADHDPVIVWLSQDKLLSNGETSLGQDNLHLYPNPVQDRLFIEIPVDWNFQSMELLDLSGRTILHFHNPRKIIDLRHFASGIYMLRLHADDAVMSFPVVKK
ncbi:MAG TPA: T9SS type A sorting domain-containing protein, partial [Saprospiraceae bacterium]|nr:T9SS type A sorting domain-containing protein [Saprospiraceae bacterium]